MTSSFIDVADCVSKRPLHLIIFENTTGFPQTSSYFQSVWLCHFMRVRSYLIQSVTSFFHKIDSSSSPILIICTGLPQGSVLGPLIFVRLHGHLSLSVIYPDLLNTSNIVSFHQYADDTQLYIGTSLSTVAHQVAPHRMRASQRVHNCRPEQLMVFSPQTILV